LRASSIGRALISTPWLIRKASSPGSTKAGKVVLKERTTCASGCAASARVPLFSVVSLLLVTDAASAALPSAGASSGDAWSAGI